MQNAMSCVIVNAKNVCSRQWSCHRRMPYESEPILALWIGSQFPEYCLVLQKWPWFDNFSWRWLDFEITVFLKVMALFLLRRHNLNKAMALLFSKERTNSKILCTFCFINMNSNVNLEIIRLWIYSFGHSWTTRKQSINLEAQIFSF